MWHWTDAYDQWSVHELIALAKGAAALPTAWRPTFAAE